MDKQADRQRGKELLAAVLCWFYFLLSAGRAEQLLRSPIHLETQKHHLPLNHSFLWNGADPRSACLFTAQRSHSASLSRNHSHKQPGPALSSASVKGGSIHALVFLYMCIWVVLNWSQFIVSYIFSLFFSPLKPTTTDLILSVWEAFSNCF